MEGKTKTAEEILSESMELRGNYNLDKFEVITLMEIYAEQEREKAVREFKERLINQLPNPQSALESFYKSEINEVIEKLK
jgi:hypothetical protein